MESLFQLLFKYRPLLFERGELTLAASWPLWAVVGVGSLLAAVALITYLPGRGDARPADRTVLAALRLLALAIVVLCLLQPALVLRSTVPQRNFVAVLLDDSRSMSIADVDGQPRHGFVDRAFAGDGDLHSALADRFAVRYFRYGEDATRLDDPGTLGFDDRDTRLAPGLDAVREELEGVPLSGVVVVGDGSAPGDEELREALLRTRAAGIPVYSVGVGGERMEPDVQVSRVELPRRVLRGSSVAADVVISHRGYGGRTVPVRVEEEGVRVAEETVTLPSDGEPTVVRVHLDPEVAGPRHFRFHVPPLDGETVPQNNDREVLVDVAEEPEKILYVEGRPRYEVKFLRRAVEEDEELQVVVLQRTAENKFLRLSVDDADELAGGFPTSREELFQYRGLVLGSVGAGFFSPDQLRMIADFVRQRGGSLLMLGGPDAFAEGDYIGTPVEDALPVVLEESRSIGPRSFLREVRVRPTPAGSDHAALQLPPEGEEEERDWTGLPRLTTPHAVRDVKPGATPLLVGEGEGDDDLVVLAWQRYGSGKSLALTVQDTWTWQMHADIPVDDQTHERFWRQLLRWMVDGVPDRLALESPGDALDPGRPAEFEVRVADSAYLGVNDARVRATVVGPDGSETDTPLTWNGEQDGVYRGTFTPPATGLYRVDVEVEREGAAPESTTGWLRAVPSDREYFDAGMDADLLTRVAEETGGRFYTPANVSTLPEDLQYSGAGITVTEERDLWDMPIFFLLLVLLVSAEWTYRRLRGLP